MPKLQGFCRWCGKRIEYWPSQDRQFCSVPCRAANRARLQMPTKPRTGAMVPCKRCGTEFWRIVSNTDAQYCSRKCHAESMRQPATVKACRVCGSTMTLKPSQSGRQFCSRSCMGLGAIVRPLERQHNGKPARKDKAGYVLLWEPTHPNKSMKGWQYEHRLVVERAIGRYLSSDEQVDHINQVKDDNRSENLQVLSASVHSSKTYADRRTEQERLSDELAAYRARYGPLTT